MIHPSYVDLMEVVNKNVEEGETPVINSRYSIVMATAKRARQIVDGDEPLVKVSRGEKPLSIAVDELNQAEIRILAEDEVEEEYTALTETAESPAIGADAAETDPVEPENAEEARSEAETGADPETMEEPDTEELSAGEESAEDFSAEEIFEEEGSVEDSAEQ